MQTGGDSLFMRKIILFTKQVHFLLVKFKLSLSGTLSHATELPHIIIIAQQNSLTTPPSLTCQVQGQLQIKVWRKPDPLGSENVRIPGGRLGRGWSGLELTDTLATFLS